jgi:hypothetical protein
MKKCSRCKQSKPRSDFHAARSNSDGLQTTCKPCQKEMKQNRYERNKAKHAPVPATTPDEFEVTWEEPAPAPLEVAYKSHTEAKQKRDLRTEHTALIEENFKLKDTIAELIKMQKAPDILVYKKPAWERSDAIACGVASDWHVEEPVIKESVHGLNEFNLEIATSRSAFYFKHLLSLTDMMARESKINTIYIAALGDFFSGWIHEELIANNLLAPGDAARFWKGLFISGIDFLLRESTYTIEMDLIPGNHGRMTRQMHFGDPTGTSLETFAYHALAGRYEGNPRVKMNVANHPMVYRRFFESFNMRLIHGYEVKYGGGVGGLTIPLNKAISQWDKAVKADLTVFGHFHQFFDGGNFIGNGSLIGYNPFAQAIKAQFEEARQAFFQISARNGGVKSITAPLWLDNAHHKKVDPQ